jgi:hypothetical protein
MAAKVSIFNEKTGCLVKKVVESLFFVLIKNILKNIPYICNRLSN